MSVPLPCPPDLFSPNLLFYAYDCFAYATVCMGTVCMPCALEDGARALELELQAIARNHVGTGNRTQVFRESGQYSSQLSSPSDF